MKMMAYIGLGLIAAVLAAILVGLLQPNRGGTSIAVDASGEATILAASRDIPAGTRLKDADLEETGVAGAEVPTGATSSRSILIGRTVLLPLTKGQAIGAAALVPSGSGPEIASRLGDGWRALTVRFSDPSIGVVLYPGAVVDVLATLEVRRAQAQQDTYVTTTVLEGVYVLAVGDKVAGVDAAIPGASKGQAKSLTLTLLVSAENAKLLELASERGSLAVALRAPNDVMSTQSRDATLEALLQVRTTAPVATVSPSDSSQSPPTAPQQSEPSVVAPIATPSSWGPTWKITVIRGSKTDTLEVKDTTRRTN